MPNPTSIPQCPHCGFTVFTSRYAKCEKCGQALPENLVLSPAERSALWESEAQRDAALQAEADAIKARKEKAKQAHQSAAMVGIIIGGSS